MTYNERVENRPLTAVAGTVATGQPILAARGLACGYGSSPVLRAVDLDLRPGEMVALLGRNGSGKSTLLRCLAAVLPALAGEVTIDTVPLQRMGRRALARLLAVVPQDLHVPFPFSVREVVELGRTPYARFLALPTAEDARAVQTALQATDLHDLADRSFQQLSGGEQQRVALAMALAQEPHVLLLDEPTVHLDLAHQAALLALVRKLCATQGLAVLAAIHDINLAALYFDRLLVLAEGGLLVSGTPWEVVTAELVERTFGARVAVSRHPTLDAPQISLLP